MVGSIEVVFIRYADIIRFAGPLLVCALALINAHANAQAGATPPVMAHQGAAQSGAPSGSKALAAEPLTTDEVCRTLEQAAAQNALPVEFFARVIWQESRFSASAVSRKGAEGIAQFMPRTADWRGLADPFDPIEALRHSAGYLRELRERFGNLGLAAAAYNAGPSRLRLLTCRLMPTCFAMAAAMRWPTPGTTPGRSRIGSGIGQFSIRSGIPSWRRRGLKTSGATRR
jgi:soluble lytic murein transglycosylase-like protein